MIIRDPSSNLHQSSLIYSKECPVCGRFNLVDSNSCWNCRWQFIDRKKKAVLLRSEKVLVGLMVLMAAVVSILQSIF